MAFKRKTSTAPTLKNPPHNTWDGNNKFSEGVKVVDWPNSPAVHDKDDNKVSGYAYDKSPSLDAPKNSVAEG